MGMKWHPQKNPSAKAESEQRFREIAEAYDVLSDPSRRKRYDDVGEKGLKFPPAGSTQFQPYQYVGDPFGLFATFFLFASVFWIGWFEVTHTDAFSGLQI